MKTKSIFYAFAAVFLLVGIFGRAQAQTVSDYKISAPYNFKNLTIFLIHGKNQTDKKNIPTLEEALEKIRNSSFMKRRMSTNWRLKICRKQTMFLSNRATSSKAVSRIVCSRSALLFRLIPAKLQLTLSVSNRDAGKNAAAKTKGNFIFELTAS